MLVGVSLITLGACDSVYLHDAEREASLTQAKDGLAAAAPATVFEKQRAFLNDLAAAERDAVTRNFKARRDLRLALWLSPPSDASAPGWQLMRTALETRAIAVAGSKWQPATKLISNQTVAKLNDIKSREHVMVAWSAYDKLPKKDKKVAPPAKKSGDRVEAICNQLRDANNAYANPHSAGDAGHTKVATLINHCKAFDVYNMTLKNADAALRDETKFGGLILDYSRRVDDTGARVKLIKAESALLKCELKAAIEAYEEAEKKTPPANLEAVRKKLLADITKKVKEVLNVKDAPAPGKKGGTKAPAKKTPDSCATEKQTRDQAAKGKKKPDAKDEGWLAKVRAEALAHLNKWLAKKITETVETGLKKATDKLTEKNRALLDSVFKAHAKFEEAKKSGELNAMLTSLAFVRYQHARAETSLAYETSKLQNAKDMQAAALREFSWIVDAHSSASPLFGTLPACAKGQTGLAGLLDTCKKNLKIKQAIAESLAAYATSTSEGQLPLLLADYRALAIEREYVLSTEENAANVHFAAIQPLADQLAAFGKGGVRKEALLGLLQAAGIFTIAAD